MDLSDGTLDLVCGDFKRVLAFETEVISRWEKLNQFRKEGEFCDVQIQSADDKHPAHKCVLATSTLYFKTLFTSPVSNCQDIIDLREFSAETINFILDCIYETETNDVERVSNLAELLQLAEFIQFDDLLYTFYERICENFKVHESYEWYLIGKMSGVTKLATIAKGYMMSHYDSVQKLEKYKDSLPLIEEIVSVKEPEFTEEIVVATGNVYGAGELMSKRDRQYKYVNKMKKVNIVSKSVESIDNCLTKFKDYPISQVFSFFVFQHNIMSVSTRNRLVYLQKHDHLPPYYFDNDEPCTNCSWCSNPLKEIKIDSVFHMFGDMFEDIDTDLFCESPADFFLESTFYNGIEYLYLIFQHMNKELLLILKVDLKNFHVSKNYITIKRGFSKKKMAPRAQTIVVLVQTQLYGTVLLDNEGGIYNIESFDFDGDTKNHTPEPLKFSMESKNKKAKRDGHLAHCMDSFTSFCCNGEDIYLISTNCYNEETIDIHWFDVKNKTWVNCSTLDVGYKLRISQSFTHQKDVYVIVQDKKTVPIMETHSTLTSRRISNLTKKAESGDELYQELYRFDASTKSITKVDIKLPSNPTFAVVPAYFFILDPYSRY